MKWVERFVGSYANEKFRKDAILLPPSPPPKAPLTILNDLFCVFGHSIRKSCCTTSSNSLHHVFIRHRRLEFDLPTNK